MTMKLKVAAVALLCVAGAALYAQQPKNSYDPNRGNDPNAVRDYSNAIRNYYSGAAPQGRIDPDERLADMEKRLEGLLAVVKALRKDLKAKGPDAASIRLKNADATTAANMLQRFFEGREGVRVEADPRANTIIILGGDKALADAKKLIEILEEGKPSEPRRK
jgi:hypothetical protein